MIRWPKPGQRVELHYRDHSFFRHLQLGHVVKSSRGPGPINVMVKMDNGEILIVPRGQLFLKE